MPTIDDFGLEEVSIDKVPADHVVVKVDTLSMDAWIRTTLNHAGMHETADIGTTIPALGVGVVIESNSHSLAVGDKVYGLLSAQTHALLPDAALKKVDLHHGITLRDYVGPLGQTTGLTAWVGLIAVAALTLSIRSQVSVESVIGYASVLALLGVAAAEYRLG